MSGVRALHDLTGANDDVIRLLLGFLGLVVVFIAGSLCVCCAAAVQERRAVEGRYTVAPVGSKSQ